MAFQTNLTRLNRRVLFHLIGKLWKRLWFTDEFSVAVETLPSRLSYHDGVTDLLRVTNVSIQRGMTALARQVFVFLPFHRLYGIRMAGLAGFITAMRQRQLAHLAKRISTIPDFVVPA